MFISYFEPIYLRNRCDIYIHYFYKQLKDYGIEEIIYLTNDDFWKSTEEWLSRNLWHLSEPVQAFHEFFISSDEILKQAKKEIIPLEIYEKLLEENANDKIQTEKVLLTEEYQPLVNYFEKLLEKLTSNYDIEGIFTVKNCPSLEVVAKKYNIPVIHYEIAALRPLNYQFLAYYDLNGVNGNTSAKEEFHEFSKIYQSNKNIKLLSNNSILKLLSRNNFDHKMYLKNTTRFKIGAALQIFDDSNLIAFSNGYNSESLIDFLCQKFEMKDIIIRNHPSTKEEKLLSFRNIDKSATALEFIQRCEKIITINSSVAFESALYGKPVYVLGQSPFEILSEDINNINKELEAKDNSLELNYLTFVYMIPYELLFNLDYIKWRLSKPNLLDLYKYHVSYYRKKYLKLLIINLIKDSNEKVKNSLILNFERIKETIKLINLKLRIRF